MPLLTTFFAANFEYWQLYHKVTFDPINKYVTINPGVTDINVQRDLYSASKEWLKFENNLRWKRPFRAAGGDAIPGGILGRTFFITNGWRIILSGTLNIDGNLYSDNFSSPYYNPNNIPMVTNKVSNLVDVANVPTSTQNAAAVWNAVMTAYIAAGSAGKILGDVGTKTTKIERTTDDNQALIISK